MSNLFNASIIIDGKKYDAFNVDCESVNVNVTEEGNGYIYRRMEIANPSNKNSAQITVPNVVEMCLDCTKELKIHGFRGSHSNWESFLVIDDNIAVGETYEMIPKNGRSSDLNVSPFIDLTVDDKAYLFALGWTGQWRFTVTRTEDKVYISGGINNADFYLKPGEKYFIGSALLMAGDDAVELRRKLRRILMTDMNPIPKSLGHMPIAQCEFEDSFETGKARYYDTQYKIIDAGNKIDGFDLYWIDAIWFPDKFPDGVGNYTYTEGFPEGFKPLAKRVHDAGKQLIAWFEPLRVRTGTQVYREHPEFLLHIDSDEETVLDYNVNDNVFNLGEEDAYQYMHKIIADIIRDNDIDHFREDFNMAPLEYWRANDEEGRSGITEIKFINNFYRLWDDLRTEFPNLMIDNCASGGRRIDLETVRRSVVLHRCDGGCGPALPGKPTDVWNQSQTIGISPYIPYQMASAWALGANYVRSAMTTGVGIIVSYARDSVDLNEVQAAVTEAKHFTQYWDGGDFYPLTEQTLDEDCFCAYQLVKGDDGYAVVFRREHCVDTDYVINFNVIDESATYTLNLIDEDRVSTTLTVSGADLAKGYKVTLPKPRTSLIAEYIKVK